MGIPGSGRYIDYIPYRSTEGAQKWLRLKGLFNDKVAAGDFYSSSEKPEDAARAARSTALSHLNDFDQGLWSTNPRTIAKETVPDLTSVSRPKKTESLSIGFPANPYMPDLRSPGAGSWSLPDSDADDAALSASSYKPNLTIGSGGTANPSANVIANPISEDGTFLNFGDSK